MIQVWRRATAGKEAPTQIYTGYTRDTSNEMPCRAGGTLVQSVLVIGSFDYIANNRLRLKSIDQRLVQQLCTFSRREIWIELRKIQCRLRNIIRVRLVR